MIKYFVWIKGLTGNVEPQIWHGKQVDGNGKDKPFLACHELTDSQALYTIKFLEHLFPYEAKS